MRTTLFISLTLALTSITYAADDAPHRHWRPGRVASQVEWERTLIESPDPALLRTWHDTLGSEPHIAGTPGDRRVIEALVETFAAMDLEVELHEFWALLPTSQSARLEILQPVSMTLPLKERPVAEDPSSRHPELPIGFNAYSGNGDVTGEVVYANYGRKQDFATLRDAGIDLRGRIVIARYGGNFRGYKARFAEEAGAAGLIIYTDPADSGYARGLPYPEGGFANETSIQRGSIKTTPWPGDPLTPFVEATENAERVDEQQAQLPRIPVQPIGWEAAQAIMSQMRGRAISPQLVRGWQGGLPFAYRFEGGRDLRVRLQVKQERKIRWSANVLARLPGTDEPDEVIIIGCHHDAWGFGASDPLAGMIAVVESARCFSEAAARGMKPRRSLLFAAWGAEEFGIIGSTEFCEARREALQSSAVAYINLDMASMGPEFGSSSAPSLKTLIEEAARVVPSPAATNGAMPVYDEWTAGGSRAASFGNLGGGSDHIGFYCHLGIPSCSLGGRGSHGTAYHSNYDSLHWYRQVVGEDYASAVMVTRMTNVVAARLAGADLLPLDPARAYADARTHLANLQPQAEQLGVNLDVLDRTLDACTGVMRATVSRMATTIAQGTLAGKRLRSANTILRGLGHRWLLPKGLPGRPWFRNSFATSDPDSGYEAWMLPLLRAALEKGDRAAAEDACETYLSICQELINDERRLAKLLEP